MIQPLGILATRAGLSTADVVTERTGLVTLGGQPATLIGDDPMLGHKAPNFTVVDQDFKPWELYAFKGTPVLISSVLSLDTGVCSRETKRFNAEAAGLPGGRLLTISMDLPYAQKRFCEAERIGGTLVFSDAVYRDFGLRYGLVIKGRGLLARCVLVVDRDGRLAYRQLVGDVGKEPDYAPALEAFRNAIGAAV